MPFNKFFALVWIGAAVIIIIGLLNVFSAESLLSSPGFLKPCTGSISSSSSFTCVESNAILQSAVDDVIIAAAGVAIDGIAIIVLSIILMEKNSKTNRLTQFIAGLAIVAILLGSRYLTTTALSFVGLGAVVVVYSSYKIKLLTNGQQAQPVTTQQAMPTSPTVRQAQQNIDARQGAKMPNRFVVALAVVAIVVIGAIILTKMQSQSSAITSTTTVIGCGQNTNCASRPNPLVANANESTSLSLPGGYDAYIFAFTDGGAYNTTPFAKGNYAVGIGANGQVDSGLAITNSSSDSYTTQDAGYAIAGAAVRDYKYYGDMYKLNVPPIEENTTFNFSFTLPEPAFVVIVTVSGGARYNTINSTTSFTVDSVAHCQTSNRCSGVGIGGYEIISADLNAGTYNFSDFSTNYDAGSGTRSELIGIFAFSNSTAGFISNPVSELK